MILTKIKTQHISTVIDCINNIREGEPGWYARHRVRSPTLCFEEKWVVNFIRYYVLKDVVSPSIDESPYYMIPTASVQDATFTAFLRLVAYYAEEGGVSLTNEKKLVCFLKRCRPEFQEFYLAVLSRQSWLRDCLLLGFYGGHKVIFPHEIYIQSPKVSVADGVRRKGRSLKGVIEDVWVENGEVLGYTVWHKWKKFYCTCTIRSRVLLFTEVVKNTVIEFKVTGDGRGAGIKIYFDKTFFRWGAHNWRQRHVLHRDRPKQEEHRNSSGQR